MDISLNENVEKVKFRDILVGLKDIFVGNNSNIDDSKLSKEIDEIYKIESEIGASTNIQTLEKQLEKHYSIEKTKRKNTTKMSLKQIEDREEAKTIGDEEIDR